MYTLEGKERKLATKIEKKTVRELTAAADSLVDSDFDEANSTDTIRHCDIRLRHRHFTQLVALQRTAQVLDIFYTT